MQSVSVPPVLANYAGGLLRFYRQGALKLWYAKLEILAGFNVYAPRNSNRRAILTYSRGGSKVFKYYMSVSDLDELFVMLELYDAREQNQQFVLGRFEFRIAGQDNTVSIGVEFLSHDVEITGTRAQLKAAIAGYQTILRRRGAAPQASAAT
jgi:hypothetical protein